MSLCPLCANINWTLNLSPHFSMAILCIVMFLVDGTGGKLPFSLSGCLIRNLVQGGTI